MIKKKFFAYIRVSTQKQGEKGVSLQEQKDAILRYAERNSLEIQDWFEEIETAAARGRPIFSQMLKLLKQGKADGLIVHKIDRSARNLRDWADIGELIDQGLEIHFANESLDLHTRGGRLSADIQAVVAADYIRNLREEIRKGIHGRLKQGLYPFRAPLGYLDEGKGKAKKIDPVKGPLIKKAFELYATASFTLNTLLHEMRILGLVNGSGGQLSQSTLATILNNPFYAGVICIKKTGETFFGIHEPLISKPLFEKVQSVLKGKTNKKIHTHSFLFSRFLNCASCGFFLIGELQKGRVYYRCHSESCPTTSLREDRIEKIIVRTLSDLQLTKIEKMHIERLFTSLRENQLRDKEIQSSALTIRLRQIQERLNRLIEAYLDRIVEKKIFEEKKAQLLMEQREIESRLLELKKQKRSLPDKIAEFLSLIEKTVVVYEMGTPEQRKQLLELVTLSRVVDKKKLDLTLSHVFELLSNRFRVVAPSTSNSVHNPDNLDFMQVSAVFYPENRISVQDGGPSTDYSRILDGLFYQLANILTVHPIMIPEWVEKYYDGYSKKEEPTRESRFMGNHGQNPDGKKEDSD